MVLAKKSETFPSFYFWQKKKKTASKTCLRKERKKAFLESKIRKLKTSKNHDFFKRVSLWFWSKI